MLRGWRRGSVGARDDRMSLSGDAAAALCDWARPQIAAPNLSIDLVLAFRRRDFQTVELIPDLDLAGQAGRLPHILGKIEHGLFHR